MSDFESIIQGPIVSALKLQITFFCSLMSSKRTRQHDRRTKEPSYVIEDTLADVANGTYKSFNDIFRITGVNANTIFTVLLAFTTVFTTIRSIYLYRRILDTV